MFPDKAPHALRSPGKQGRLPKSHKHPSPSSFPWKTPSKSRCPQPTSLKTQVPVQRVVKQAGKGALKAGVTEVCNIPMSPEEISDERVMTHCLLCKTRDHPMHPACPKEMFLHRISPDAGG